MTTGLLNVTPPATFSDWIRSKGSEVAEKILGATPLDDGRLRDYWTGASPSWEPLSKDLPHIEKSGAIDWSKYDPGSFYTTTFGETWKSPTLEELDRLKKELCKPLRLPWDLAFPEEEKIDSLLTIRRLKDMEDKIFIAIILEKPFKKEQEEEGKQAKILVDPFVVIADDEDDAVVQALLKKAEEIKDCNKRKLKVFVRPF